MEAQYVYYLSDPLGSIRASGNDEGQVVSSGEIRVFMGSLFTTGAFPNCERSEHLTHSSYGYSNQTTDYATA
jgi:hypothetical protein